MFQFTTTNVINSDKDLTTGKPLWSAQDATESRPASLHIKRVNNFKSSNVVAIYKAHGYNAQHAYATFDLNANFPMPNGDTFRLYILVGLTQGSADSRYANDMAYKAKPFTIDFVAQVTPAETVKKLVKMINKYELMVYGTKLLNVVASGTCITIMATDEYQKLLKVQIDQFDKEANHGMGEYKTVRSLEDLPRKTANIGVPLEQEGYFIGKEGFGTYSWLLHNLRIPTCARTGAFAQNQDETPIVGAVYNQYIIYYCANRGILGDNAVGDLVQSRTTHVFYVKNDLAQNFEIALSKIGVVMPTVGGQAPDPETIKTDLAALAKVVDTHTKQIATKADKAIVEADYLKKEEAGTTYVKTAEAETKFVKTTDAEAKYQTKTDSQSLAAQYTKTDVLESTYIKKQDLSDHKEELKTFLNAE